MRVLKIRLIGRILSRNGCMLASLCSLQGKAALLALMDYLKRSSAQPTAHAPGIFPDSALHCSDVSGKVALFLFFYFTYNYATMGHRKIKDYDLKHAERVAVGRAAFCASHTSGWCTPGTGVNLWGESPLYENRCYHKYE